VDLLFLHVTTYALSSTVLPVVRRVKVSVILLNLQPTAAMDDQRFNAMGDRTRMTGEWLAHCSACPVPEIANVFHRARIPVHQVTGMQPIQRLGDGTTGSSSPGGLGLLFALDLLDHRSDIGGRVVGTGTQRPKKEPN
jgi:hypothetical protein